ncbi:MAG: metallophosphoesterase [Phycisphaerales bacterium]
MLHPRTRAATALLLLSALACAVQATLQADGQRDPSAAAARVLVAPYLQHMTHDGVTIMWEASVEGSAGGQSVVEYGPARLGDAEPNLELRATAQPADRAKSTVEGGLMHRVRLTGLSPATPYFYRVRLPDGSFSEAFSFQTAPPPEDTARPVAFAVVGDSQNNPEVWGRISASVWGHRPEFVVHAGDLVGTGQITREWREEFFAPAAGLLARVPVFSVLGNHENDAANYYRYTDAPAPHHRHAMRWGAAAFYFIDSNRDCTAGAEQYEWLEWSLAACDAPWRFVVLHHPPVTSDENDYGDTYKALSPRGDGRVADLIPLFERHGVDVVFFGHIHSYERSWPLRAGRVDHGRGVTYMQVGGSGGSLERPAPTRSWFTAALRSDHHYLTVALAGDHLEISAFDQQGRRFDHVQIDKGPHGPRAALAGPRPPVIRPHGGLFTAGQRVAVHTPGREGLTVRYTLDGSTPAADAPVYGGELVLEDDAVLTVAAFDDQGRTSEPNTARFERVEPRPAANVDTGAIEPGLRVAYYEGAWKFLPDFGALEPVRTGVAERVRLEAIDTREDHFALRFDGLVYAPADGVYTFECLSDDGSRLWIGDASGGTHEVVENDGSHSTRSRRGQIALARGWHPITIGYFEDYAGSALRVSWSGPGFAMREIEPSSLAHRP